MHDRILGLSKEKVGFGFWSVWVSSSELIGKTIPEHVTWVSPSIVYSSENFRKQKETMIVSSEHPCTHRRRSFFLCALYRAKTGNSGTRAIPTGTVVIRFFVKIFFDILVKKRLYKIYIRIQNRVFFFVYLSFVCF